MSNTPQQSSSSSANQNDQTDSKVVSLPSQSSAGSSGAAHSIVYEDRPASQSASAKAGSSDKGTSSAPAKSKAKAKKTAVKKPAVKKPAAKTASKTAAKKAAYKSNTKSKATRKASTASKAQTPTSTRAKKEDINMAKANNTVNFQDYSKQAYEGFEQFTTYGKEFFDAWLQSSNIAATQAQELFKDTFSATQQASESTLAQMKELMTCRSLNEFTEKQNAFTQEAFNQGMTTATEFTERYIKLCTEAAEPLNKSVTSNVERATKAAGRAA